MRNFLIVTGAITALVCAVPAQAGAPEGNPAFCDGFYPPEDPSEPDSGPGFGPFDKYEEEDDDAAEWPFVSDIVHYYKEYLSTETDSGYALGLGIGHAECFPNSPR